MLQVIWDTRNYLFWLIVVSALCLILERLRPWRRKQKLLRRQFAQDLFWLVFNGQYAGLLVAHVAAFVFIWAMPWVDQLKSLNLLAAQSLWLQFLAFFLLRDFLEWGVHNLLHRIPWLWEFHKLHHSIEEMDWIGNFRFHWAEIVIYQGFTYLPLVMLGVNGGVILAIAVVVTLIGHLNHSNLNISWGPLRYMINSPRMHVWHHDYDWPADHPHGVNFGIALSLWDWIFGTAYWPSKSESPEQQPMRLGFQGIERFPRGLLARFFYPLSGWVQNLSGSGSKTRATHQVDSATTDDNPCAPHPNQQSAK
jgi:sterol desaturase/sphingolipid hydroxylase (fatty acid hydroxylase superfamily)